MPWEDRDFATLLLQVGVNAVWVLLPLVPAIVIYRIFPDTKVAVAGPFHALSVRAGGAFAAYLIVFVATYPLIDEMNRNLASMYDRQWIVRGSIVVRDEQGKEIRLPEGAQPLTVGMRPDIVTLRGNRFQIIVPERDDQIPGLFISYPGFATQWIELDRLGGDAGVRVDRRRQEIEITAPLNIQREPCQGPGC
ncbi:MAG TPA: hypothetical protein VN231_09410 [Allosphingosinicella sp.]|nr:hypothetical protein [Allosphingosinicella sp.]